MMSCGCNCKNILKTICNSKSRKEFTQDIQPMASKSVRLRIHQRHELAIMESTICLKSAIKSPIEGTGMLFGMRLMVEKLGIHGTEFTVIKESEEHVELSFSRPWDTYLERKLAPLNIDKRFILLRGCSGFYTYAIYEHVRSDDKDYQGKITLGTIWSMLTHSGIELDAFMFYSRTQDPHCPSIIPPGINLEPKDSMSAFGLVSSGLSEIRRLYNMQP